MAWIKGGCEVDDTEIVGIISEKAVKVAVGVLAVSVTVAIWYLGLKEVVLGVLYYAAIIGQ